MDSDAVRATVDPDVCALSGYCVQVAPALFRIGADHAESLLDPIEGAELRELALEAESVCPTAAIRIEDY